MANAYAKAGVGKKMLRLQDCVWHISTEIIRRRYMTMNKNIRNH